jgi:hypothetical protein
MVKNPRKTPSIHTQTRTPINFRKKNQGRSFKNLKLRKQGSKRTKHRIFQQNKHQQKTF